MLAKIKRFLAHAYIKLFIRVFPYLDFEKCVNEKHTELLKKFMHLLLFDYRDHTIRFVKEAAGQYDYIRELMSSDKVRENGFRMFRDEVISKTHYSDRFWSDKDIQLKVFKVLSEESDFVFGDVTKCELSKDGIFHIMGWHVPVQNYGHVEIYSADTLLGVAHSILAPKDIRERFGVYNSNVSGWEYIINLKPEQRGLSEVKVCLIKDVRILSETSAKVNKSEFAFKAPDKLWIDINSFKIINEVAQRRVMQFNTICHQLSDWFDWTQARYHVAIHRFKEDIAYGKVPVQDIFMDIITENNVVQFKNARMKIQDKKKFWIIMNELLIEQEYFFESDNETPVIIDAGANVGLAVLYFKTLFPKAKIKAFEPEPEAFSLLSENVLQNGWRDVEIYQLALSDTEEKTVFNTPKNDCLGGSLTERAYEYPEPSVDQIVVETGILNEYVTESVDYLKLDIEGVELRVLRKLGDKLRLVKHLFCEYHYGQRVHYNSFAELITLLDKHGFDFQIGKSPSYHASTHAFTMKYVGQRLSLNIWAKKRIN